MAAVLLHLYFAFVIWVCLIFPSVLSGRCPSSCSCLGNNVDCSKKGLTHVPTDIEPWVTRLELQSNGIRDIRLEDFKRLRNLTHLDLSKNDIGVINGSVFKDLVKLTTLYLNSNQMTAIPQFPAPMNITELSIRENHVVTIPLSVMKMLPKIERLDLTQNYILSITNGSFPHDCPLNTLILNKNNIGAIERGSLSNLTKLEVLKINQNRLTELPQGVFSTLSSLRNLELMRNKLSVILGLTFKGLTSLQVLKLKRNNIVALKDGAFYGLKISSLQMDKNRISNITKGWLYGLRSLKQLSLPYNQISTIQTDAWKVCHLLDKLNLTHNRLTAIEEHSFSHLQYLKSLDLDYNRISRIDSGAFRDLENLSKLQLNHNEISWAMEDLPGAFRGLTGLTKLGLSHNEIRAIAVHTFSGLPRLRQLSLDHNQITSVKENAFETLRHLRDLHFNTSQLFCDCHLSWLPVWLQHNGFQSTAQGVCHHPAVLKGLDMYQVDPDQLTCTKLPKPVIVDNPKSANGFQGENMTLSCTVGISGDSQPIIHWKKDNLLLGDENCEVEATSDGEVNRYTSKLTLVAMEDSMAGSYHCIVSNDFGSAFSQRAYVNVYVFPSFTKKPKDVTVKAGKPAELKCAAAGKPKPTISWQKDGGDSFPAARERRMHVYPLDDRFYIMNTRPADEGVYSCMARSAAGLVVHNATVTVLETPDFLKRMQPVMTVREGETAVLKCMASGNPRPKLTWLKNGKDVVESSHHLFTTKYQALVILESKASDAGIYSCRISNSLGTAKGVTRLKIVAPSGSIAGVGVGEEESHEDTGNDNNNNESSFGLDDESTTTGIIIIAVVCCVVGTSLVWVIIIYQTRKRHDMYSPAPTDETTLPVEVPSSGYMSSDKEGSYTTTAQPGYYYCHDYQMKESGYESSSGQYRINGHSHNRMAAMFDHGDDDDDDQNPPVVTAGDRLLQQIRDGQSENRATYPVSDGEDTVASRHSSSSGNHSSSDPPSSHHSTEPHCLTTPYSQINQPLTIATCPMVAPSEGNYSNLMVVAQNSQPSPLSDESNSSSGSSNGCRAGSASLQHPHLNHHRPAAIHLQTFHPTPRHTNHNRLKKMNRSASAISAISTSDVNDEVCHCCDCDSNCYKNNDNFRFNNIGVVPRGRHHSTSCDYRDDEYLPPPPPPPPQPSSTCAACHSLQSSCNQVDKPHPASHNRQAHHHIHNHHHHNQPLREIRSPILLSSRSDNNVNNVHKRLAASAALPLPTTSSPSRHSPSNLNPPCHNNNNIANHNINSHSNNNNNIATCHGCLDRGASQTLPPSYSSLVPSSSSNLSRKLPSSTSDSNAPQQINPCTNCNPPSSSYLSPSTSSNHHIHTSSSPSPSNFCDDNKYNRNKNRSPLLQSSPHSSPGKKGKDWASKPSSHTSPSAPPPYPSSSSSSLQPHPMTGCSDDKDLNCHHNGSNGDCAGVNTRHGLESSSWRK